MPHEIMNQHLWLPVVFAIFFIFLASYCRGQTPLPRPKACWNVSASEQDVADKYFTRYGNWQRPRLNSSQPVNVNITFVLSSINDVLEKDRIIKVTAYISVRWMDEFHVWMDDFPYNCVDYVVLPATYVWLPDIAQMNAEGRYTLMAMPGEKVRIYSNGYTIFSPGGTFMAFCDYDLTFFPFDYQKCAIKLESWRYTAIYMTFQFGSNLTIKQYSENEQWALAGTSQAKIGITYLDPGNSFDHIEFYISLRRKVMYYLMNIIIPSCIISVAQLATFSLPVDEVMKIHISFTCLLAYSVFQLMIVDDMPRSSDHVPLLSIYIDLQMAYISLSMVFEGGVFLALRQADAGHRNPSHVPQWVYEIVGFIGKLTFVGDPPDEPQPMDPNDPKLQQTTGATNTLGVIEQKFNQSGVFSTPDEMTLRFPSLLDSKPVMIGSRYTEMTRALMPPKSDQEADAGYVHRHHLSNIRQLRWQYCADVIDRLTCLFYILCITLTPVGMFLVYPNANAHDTAFTGH